MDPQVQMFDLTTNFTFTAVTKKCLNNKQAPLLPWNDFSVMIVLTVLVIVVSDHGQLETRGIDDLCIRVTFHKSFEDRNRQREKIHL